LRIVVVARTTKTSFEGVDRTAGRRPHSGCSAQKICRVSPGFVIGRALGLCEAPHRIAERDRMHL
jgi:hypothetical protein